MGRSRKQQCSLAWTTAWPFKDERDPASEQDAMPENKAACAIARERRTALRRQQPGKDDAAVRREQSCDRGGELLEWSKHDVREDEPVRRAFEQPPVGKSGGMNDVHVRRHAV